MQFQSPSESILQFSVKSLVVTENFSCHSSAFTVPVAGVCSLDVFLPFTVFFHEASLSGWVLFMCGLVALEIKFCVLLINLIQTSYLQPII